jgi:hypothetical protein
MGTKSGVSANEPAAVRRSWQTQDKLIRLLFRILDFVSEFLERFLMVKIKPGSLQVLPSQLVDLEFNSTVTDILLSATIDGMEVEVLLMVEHQSSADKHLTTRFARNTVTIWEEARHKNSSEHPLVLAIALLNSTKRWTGPLDSDLLSPKISSLPEKLREVVLHQKCFSIDIQDLNDTQIINYLASYSLRLGLLVMKNSRKGNFPKMLVAWEPLWRGAANNPKDLHVAKILLRYLPHVSTVTRETIWQVGEMIGMNQVMTKRCLADELADEFFGEPLRTRLQAQLERRYGQIPDSIQDKVDSASLEEIYDWIDRETKEEIQRAREEEAKKVREEAEKKAQVELKKAREEAEKKAQVELKKAQVELKKAREEAEKKAQEAAKKAREEAEKKAQEAAKKAQEAAKNSLLILLVRRYGTLPRMVQAQFDKASEQEVREWIDEEIEEATKKAAEEAAKKADEAAKKAVEEAAKKADEAAKEVTRKSLEKLLVWRFGPLTALVQSLLSIAPLQKLEKWMDDISDAKNLDEVFA